jgi:hypothetical protein
VRTTSSREASQSAPGYLRCVDPAGRTVRLDLPDRQDAWKVINRQDAALADTVDELTVSQVLGITKT